MRNIGAVCLSLIILSVANAGNCDKNKKFILGVDGDYQSWSSEISSYQYNSEELSSEVISNYNSDNDFTTKYHSYGFVFGYNVTNNLLLTTTIGIATAKHITNQLKEDITGNNVIFSSNDPGIKSSLKLYYDYHLNDKWSLSATPEISYYIFRNLHVIRKSASTGNSEDYTIHQNLTDWSMSFTINYQLDRFTPFVGIRYHDFSNAIQYDDVITDSFNNTSEVERDIVFDQKAKLAGIVGVSVKLLHDVSFVLKANYGAGYSIHSNIFINL